MAHSPLTTWAFPVAFRERPSLVRRRPGRWDPSMDETISDSGPGHAHSLVEGGTGRITMRDRGAYGL